MHEARINGLHRVAKRYIETGAAEKEAFSEQVERLPEKIATDVTSFIADYEGKESLESKVAHDSDLVECLIQAREYPAQGMLM